MHCLIVGECISGALCWKELYQIAQEVGFSEPRLMESAAFNFKKEALTDIVGECRFATQITV